MRIQILPLPDVFHGDQMEQPFALIVDQADVMNQAQMEMLLHFRAECGARSLLVLADTVEVVDRYAEPTPPKVVVDTGVHVNIPKDFDRALLAKRLQAAFPGMKVGVPCPGCGHAVMGDVQSCPLCAFRF